MRKGIGGQEMKLTVRQPGKRPTAMYPDQWVEFAAAIREKRESLASGASAVPAIRLMEQAYAVRKPLPQPWMEPEKFGL